MWQCNLLQRILATYVVNEIQDAIEYENLMNLYEYSFTTSNSEEEIQQESNQLKLQLVQKLTS